MQATSLALQPAPDHPLSSAELQALAARPSLPSSDPSDPGNAENASNAGNAENGAGGLTVEQLARLREQCAAAPHDWWLGKFVKVEVPLSRLAGGDMPVREAGESEERRIVAGEVVGRNENGFVVRVGTTTVAVDDFIRGADRCWLLLKEGYPNLALYS